MAFYNEHPQQPDRWHHTTPDPHAQMMLGLDGENGEAAIERLIDAINEVLGTLTPRQRDTWRLHTGVRANGTVEQGLTFAQIGDLVGGASANTIRTAYLEAHCAVLSILAHPDFQAKRVSTSRGVANLLLQINSDEPQPIADPGREETTVAHERIVEPTRARNFETHGMTLPCDDGMPRGGASVPGHKLVEYQERMLARSAS
jgi:hypothetical protein